MITLANVIKFKRLELHMTQEDLAKRISILESTSVTAAHICTLESSNKATSIPRIKRLTTLSIVLGIDLNYLCYLAGKVNEPLSVDEETFKAAWTVFSNELASKEIK